MKMVDRLKLLFLVAASAIAVASADAAEPKPEYPSAVAVFARLCLTPGIEPASRLAAIKADPRWREDPHVSVDIEKMGISRAIPISAP